MSEGSDQASEAKHQVPWLTYALVAVCVGFFLLGERQAMRVDAVIGAELATAEEFLVEHPYLTPPPLLAERLSPEAAGQLEELPSGGRRSASVLSRLLEREQAELDEMVEQVAAHLEGLPAERYGLRASDPSSRAVVTHALVHGGWLHLVGNLIVLLVLGTFLERAFRLGWYTLTAAGALTASALAWIFVNADYAEPLIGTSGLLAGLLGAFAVRYGGASEEAPTIPVLIATPLVLVLPACLGFEWSVARGVGAAPAVAGGLNPSLWAMAGGLFAGAAAAGCAKLIGLERRAVDATSETAPEGAVDDPQYQRALELERVGDLDAAFNLLTGVLRRYPDDFDASTVLWEVASDLGRPRAASAAILRVIREEIQRGDKRNAVKHWLEMASCDLGVTADTALLMRMAPLLREGEEFDAAAGVLREALGRPVDDDEAAVRIAVRVVREAAGIDPLTARDAAWRALGSPVLALEERQEIEELLAEIEPQFFDDADVEAESEGFEPVAMVSDEDLMAPDEAEASIDAAVRESADDGPDAIEVDESSRELECLIGVPFGVDAHGVVIELEAGLKKRVPYKRIEAIGVSAVDGLGPKTVLIVDLVFNWVSLSGEPLRLIRLRTDRFDPRYLVPDAADPLQALRALIVRLLDETDALPLPDRQSAVGTPFAAFASLSEYETHVLMVGDARNTD